MALWVLLNAALVKDTAPLGMLGLPRLYKPVTLGATIGNTDAQTLTYQAVCLKPYAPVHVSASRDGAGNITFGWVRRTRVGGAVARWGRCAAGRGHRGL